MRKKIFFILAAVLTAVSGSAQLAFENADFEQWENVSYTSTSGTEYKGIEPVNWNSYLTGTGSVKVALVAHCPGLEKGEARPGSTGSTSVLIKAQNFIAKNFAGNLTSGCIEMGNLDQSQTAVNYNYTNTSVGGQAMKFTGRPDAMKVWARFKGANKGQISVYLHSNGRYQFPIATGSEITATMVGSASQFVESTDAWKEFTVPFSYVADGNPAYALISFTTSNIPGKGSTGDYMYIDDISLIYYSELTAIKYDGTSILGQSTVDAAFEESKLTGLKSNGAGAAITHSYDEATKTLTVKVVAQDGSSEHTYSYVFSGKNPTPDPGPGPDPTPEEHTWPVAGTVKTFTDQLVVTINGTANTQPSSTVTVTYKDNGVIDFSLKDFVLKSNGDEIPVGNIEISDIPQEWADTISKFSFNGNISIPAGSDPSKFWMGPYLGAIPLVMSGEMNDRKLHVNILINLMSTMSQMVVVSFGTEFQKGGGGDTPGPSPDPDPQPEPTPDPWALPTSGTKVYTEDLYVGVGENINGPMDCPITITFHDNNTIDLALYNFVLQTGEDKMYVGNIVINNVSLNDTGHHYSTFEYNGSLTIAEGTEPSDAFWLGPILGEMALPTAGKISREKLYVTIKLSAAGQQIDVKLGNLSYFDELDTGIGEIHSSEYCVRSNFQSAYDLQGRRTSLTGKGLKIIDGKLIKR